MKSVVTVSGRGGGWICGWVSELLSKPLKSHSNTGCNLGHVC